MIRVAIIGMGKMGKAIDALAAERGCQVVARLDAPDTAKGIDRAKLGDAQVAIEFTTPAAAPMNIRALIDAGIPTVVGTTGWYETMPEIVKLVSAKQGALLTASNFSPGVNAFETIVAAASAALKRAGGFDMHMIETHHAAKKDAPSGTASTLAAAAEAAWGSRPTITSVRTGSVPGTHEILFDAPFESIRIEHVARDRRVFADGALAAARWLVGKRGVFTMKDVIQDAR